MMRRQPAHKSGRNQRQLPLKQRWTANLDIGKRGGAMLIAEPNN
jgi:hypothetical protein